MTWIETIRGSVDRLQKFLWLVFGVIGVVSVYYHKQIYTDSAIWFYQIMNLHTPVVDPPYLRYSSTVVQLPTQIWARLGGSLSGGLTLFNLSYFIYPFLGMWGLGNWLKKIDRRDLLAPVIQSFLLTIVPTWAFANGVAPEAIVLSWFLLVYVWAYPQPKAWVVLLLGSTLLVSYESSFVYYLAAGWILMRSRKLTPSLGFILGFMTLLQLTNLSINILPADAHVHFRGSFAKSFGAPTFYLALAFMLVTFLLRHRSLMVKYLAAATFAGLCFCLGFYFLRSSYSHLWGLAYYSRVWCVPLSGLIFMLAFELKDRGDKISDELQKWLVVFIFFPLLIQEVLLLNNSRQLKEKFTGLLESYTGCVHLDFSQQPPLQKTSLQPQWTLPYISLALNPEPIKTIFFHQPGPEVTKGCTYQPGGLRIIDYPSGIKNEIYLEGFLDLRSFLPN